MKLTEKSREYLEITLHQEIALLKIC